MHVYAGIHVPGEISLIPLMIKGEISCSGVQKALLSCLAHGFLPASQCSTSWWRTGQDSSKVCGGSGVLTAELFFLFLFFFFLPLSPRRGSLLRLSHVALLSEGFALCGSLAQPAMLRLKCEMQHRGTRS